MIRVHSLPSCFLTDVPDTVHLSISNCCTFVTFVNKYSEIIYIILWDNIHVI